MAMSQAAGGVFKSVIQRKGVRQFVKFCIVGATSTAINLAVFSFLIYGLRLKQVLLGALADNPSLRSFVEAHHLYVHCAVVVAFVLAVTNGYIWNSRWTFRGVSQAAQHTLYIKFVLVNVIGLCLNLAIVTVVLRLWHVTDDRSLVPLFAQLLATAVVVFWNFLANKYWTFKS